MSLFLRDELTSSQTRILLEIEIQKLVDARKKASASNVLLANVDSSVAHLAKTYTVKVGDDDVVYLSNQAGVEETFVVHGVIGVALLPSENVLRK